MTTKAVKNFGIAVDDALAPQVFVRGTQSYAPPVVVKKAPAQSYWMQPLAVMATICVCSLFIAFIISEQEIFTEFQAKEIIADYVTHHAASIVDNEKSHSLLKAQVDELSARLKKVESSANEFTREEIAKLLLLIEDKVDINELDRILADFTGRPDFALRSIGGRIIDANVEGEAPLSFWKSFLINKKNQLKSRANAILEPSTVPGNCWAFDGQAANVTIRLSCPTNITAISIDHAPRNLLIKGNEAVPRNFQVWGSAVKNHTVVAEEMLVNSAYDFEGGVTQLFELSTSQQMSTWEFVTLKILTNYGSPATCIYRFRVHGTKCAIVNKMDL